ncbi:S-adenosyl-L-methionine-dependent methyltransferase, partial [Elsinoe ampelina]
THMATNAPIPLHLTGPNILRSPTSLRPLHGDFGPLLPPSHNPTDTDFASAFWTTTTQNGIHQVWAPRYTMFSAGNIREKTRLLNNAGVRKAVEGGPCAAVDLYVGIGYFAFSYLKAGVLVVVGWDLNAWSVEGARRGAARNGWGVQRGEQGGKVREGTRLVLFCGDNTGTKRGLEGLGGLPAVRHVNCGLLPSSRGGWGTAVEVLDREMGGWVHVHENFGVGEIGDRAEEVRREMEGLVGRTQGWAAGTQVRIDEVFKVKTYAPGVWHCVVDIHIDPRGSSN